METLSFFKAVSFGDQPKSCLKSFLEVVDSYFYLGGRKAYVIPGHTKNGSEGIELIQKNSPACLTTALKISSYFIVPISVLILTIKVVLRSIYRFHVIEKNNSNLNNLLLSPAKIFAADTELHEVNPVASKTIQSLPSEMIKNIFSFLNDEERQKALATSHFLMDVSKKQEFRSITLFIEFLVENIDFLVKNLNDTQKKEFNEGLNSINTTTIAFNSKNLLSVQFLLKIQSATELREKTINILKNFSENILITLKELSTAKGNHNFSTIIFDLVAIYKKIDDTMAIGDKKIKQAAFVSIFEELIKRDAISKAIEVAHSAGEYPFDKEILLGHLADALTKNGNIGTAIEVINKMSNAIHRIPLYKNISEVLINKAIAENPRNDDDSLKFFCNAINEAIEITNLIHINLMTIAIGKGKCPFKLAYISAIENISKALMEKAVTINCNNDKSFETFIEMVDKAIEVAHRMDEKDYANALRFISTTLKDKAADLNNDEAKKITHKAIEVAHMISNRKKPGSFALR